MQSPNDMSTTVSVARVSASPTPHKRKSPAGKTTSDIVHSAHMGSNAEVFRMVMDLHVPAGAMVADVTYGKGAFWQHVPEGKYNLHASDLNDGIDCRSLPYDDESVGCVVLDPPYMEGFYRRNTANCAGQGSYSTFLNHYSGGAINKSKHKYQDAVLHMYIEAGAEAHQVLCSKGILIVKCQDAVSANMPHLTHVDITNSYRGMGFYAKDLFVLVRRNKPAISRLVTQRHARKNHSYFLVFVKLDRTVV